MRGIEYEWVTIRADKDILSDEGLVLVNAGVHDGVRLLGVGDSGAGIVCTYDPYMPLRPDEYQSVVPR